MSKNIYENTFLYYCMANSTLKYQSTAIVDVDTACFDVPVLSHTYADGCGTIVFDGCLTRLGDNAFNKNNDLVSVECPHSLLVIGARAFAQCENLESVIVGNNLQQVGEFAFAQCTKLSRVALPDSVTAIGMYAFNTCWSLTSFDIPKGVTKIEEWTFNAAGLTRLTIPENVKEIGYRAFARTHIQSLVIPGS